MMTKHNTRMPTDGYTFIEVVLFPQKHYRNSLLMDTKASSAGQVGDLVEWQYGEKIKNMAKTIVYRVLAQTFLILTKKYIYNTTKLSFSVTSSNLIKLAMQIKDITANHDNQIITLNVFRVDLLESSASTKQDSVHLHVFALLCFITHNTYALHIRFEPCI